MPGTKQSARLDRDRDTLMREPKGPKEKAAQSAYFSRREKQDTLKGWRDEAKKNAKEKGVPYRKEYAAEDAQRRAVSRREQQAYLADTGKGKKRTTRKRISSK